MDRFASVMKKLVSVEKFIVGILMVLAVVVIMISVVGRRIGSAPAWSEEVVRYSIIWVTFFGSGVCFRRQIHYGVDVIRRVKNEKFQKGILAFVTVVSMIFALVLLVLGTRYVLFTMSTGQTTAATNIPIWIIYMPVPIGGFLVFVHLIEVFMDSVLGIYRIEE